MSNSIENFNKFDYIKSTNYIEFVKEYKNIKIREVKEEFKKDSGFFMNLLGGLIFMGICAIGGPVGLIIGLVLLTYHYISAPIKRRKALKIEIEEIENNNTLLNTFLNSGNTGKIGETFFIKHNKITNTNKREYLGKVFLSFGKDKNTIYIQEDEEVLEKEFKISDIISFKRISHEGLGDIKVGENHDEDIINLIDSENRASQLGAEASFASATGGRSFSSDIRSDYAQKEAREDREKLHKKITDEKERLKNETELRLMEFNDGDSLLLSHLKDSVVLQLEGKIENQ